jgi:hypothetical protein
MKKLFVALFLMGSTTAVVAQDSTDLDLQTDKMSLESGGAYQARTTMNIPSHLRLNFTTANPDALDVTWYEMNDNYYRAVHNREGRLINTYYAPNGNSYLVALPVLQSWIPEEVVNTALSSFGSNIYSVNKVKVAGGRDAYQVTVIENGIMRNEWIGEDGMAITDVWRTGDDMENGILKNSTEYAGKQGEDVKVKTKVEKADGTEIKTKTKNGKTKVKTDD